MRKFKGNHSSDIYTEVFSDEKGSLLEWRGGLRDFYSTEAMRNFFTEIKEPLKLTVWKNVWQRKDGSYFFGCDLADEISAQKDVRLYSASISKFIKTVKVEVEIEQ